MKGYEKIFEEIIVENFPNMEKEIVNQFQEEAQRVPYRINPRRSTPRHILIKLTKTKHKERILKAAVDSISGKIPWRREWRPTAVLLPGRSCGQSSLEGYSPWDLTELDTTE